MTKHIETCWRGYRFRSRLEARWAVFFDALQIKFEYEPEGFELSNGQRYLPDFWLPKFHSTTGLFVEVKPTGNSDFSKPRQFVRDGLGMVLLAVGPPEPCHDYDVVFLDGEAVVTEWPHRFLSKYLPGGRNADEYRLYWFPESIEDGDEIVRSAVAHARGARFEFADAEPFITS